MKLVLKDAKQQKRVNIEHTWPVLLLTQLTERTRMPLPHVTEHLDHIPEKHKITYLKPNRSKIKRSTFLEYFLYEFADEFSN